jgi:hypothetical protein
MINSKESTLMKWRTITLAVSVAGTLLASQRAFAAQATASDIADFITRLAGWFQSDPVFVTPAPSSPSIPPDSFMPGTSETNPPEQQQSIQASYTAALSNNNNTLTIQMTVTNELGTSAVASGTGPLCLVAPILTESVSFDIREVQAILVNQQVTKTILNIEDGNFKNTSKKVQFPVSQVLFQTRTKKNLIRKKTTTSWQPPSSSNSGNNPNPGANPNPGPTPNAGGTPSASLAACSPAIDQNAIIATAQKDVAEYPIEFSDLDQAEYLVMLLDNLAPTLAPLSTNLLH